MHAKAHQVAHYNTERHNEARKIDLSENIGVVSEYRTGFGETVGKVVPGGDARHVEERLWQAVSTEPCEVAKNEGEDDGDMGYLYAMDYKGVNDFVLLQMPNKKLTIVQPSTFNSKRNSIYQNYTLYKDLSDLFRIV